jgi:hypothetical protein
MQGLRPVRVAARYGAPNWVTEETMIHKKMGESPTRDEYQRVIEQIAALGVYLGSL